MTSQRPQKPKAALLARITRKDGRLIVIDLASGTEHNDLFEVCGTTRARVELIFATCKPFLGKATATNVSFDAPAAWIYTVPRAKIDLSELGF
jgi:hypothetical protein